MLLLRWLRPLTSAFMVEARVAAWRTHQHDYHTDFRWVSLEQISPHAAIAVIASKGIMADSLTKVVSILDPEKSMPIIDGMADTAALLIRKTDKGEETFTSKRFVQIRQKNTKD